MKEDEKLPETENLEEENSHYKLGIFYFNPDDKRPFPPKRYGYGWGVNWANPYAAAFMLAIVVACIADSIYHIHEVNSK